MLGEKGIELIKEADRTRDLMGPFNEDKVRQVLEESRNIHNLNIKEAKELNILTPAIRLRHDVIGRNRRCLLAYINNRMNQIEKMRWQFGVVLPQEIKSNLCEREQEFFVNYGKDLANYMRSIGDGMGLDLLTDLQPPKSLYIEVRCKQDYGEIETPDGDIVALKKNSQHFLPRVLCEPLIRQGILDHVPH